MNGDVYFDDAVFEGEKVVEDMAGPSPEGTTRALTLMVLDETSAACQNVSTDVNV